MKIKEMFFSFLMIFLLTNSVNAGIYFNSTIENTTLEGENVFSGNIYIKGRVTVSEGSSLKITPGTRIIFTFIDYENDGIGDSEILSQGKITVLGEKNNPVIFESDKKHKGSWLGLSIMNVDAENIINHAIFEDSYMALHSHFSNLNVNNCIFRDNFRGFQSQEGTISIKNSKFYNNNTALQFRNSRAKLENIEIFNNYGGLNFLYSESYIENLNVYNNTLFNIKIRYSNAQLNNVKISESYQNLYSKNSNLFIKDFISENSIQRGLSFEESTVELKNAKIKNNLLDGISIDGTKLDCENVIFDGNSRFDIYVKNKSLITGECLKNANKNKIFFNKDNFSSNN